MMSTGGTSRASRGSKDKSTKTQQIQNVKPEGTPNKNQPTAEQMRLAQMISDRNDVEDPELQKKIKQVMDLTGRSNDDVIVALHDCDNDTNRAVNMLLEGENDQGEWQESTKKKKRVSHSSAQRGADSNNKDGKPDIEDKRRDRSESSTRGSRAGPPRMQGRGGGRSWKGKENEENEKNRADSRDRDRGGKGRGGRGSMNGPRGRGRGGRAYMNRGNRFNNHDRFSGDKGPQIDTWTNETAANAEKGSGAWGDMTTEDWASEEWTGSLSESKVFTSSVKGESNVFQAPKQESNIFQAPVDNAPDVFSVTNESNVFDASMVESQVFTPTVTLPEPEPPRSMNAGSMNTNKPDALQQNALPQRLDLAALLQQKPTVNNEPVSSVAQQQSQFMSAFAKQATESIKNAVGIGTSSQQSQMSSSMCQSMNNQAQRGGVTSSAAAAAAAAQSLQQQRPKPQRSKLPPPSKIPASAVEMPGHVMQSLDIQFGGMDFGFSGSNTDGYSTGMNNSVSSGSVTATSMSMTNHLPQVNNQSVSEQSVPSLSSSIMPNVSPSKPTSVTSLEQQGITTSPSSRSNLFQNSNAGVPSPSKDYVSQGVLTQSAKMPSFQQSSYSSQYGQSAGYNKAGSAGSYSHQSGLQSHIPTTLPSHQNSQSQYGQYPTGSFQSQTYSSSQGNQNSLYQGSNQSSSFPSQTGSTYQAGSGSPYQSQSSSYHSRESQSSSSYQPSASQSVSSYQSGVVSQAGSSYTTSQTGSSYTAGQSNAYNAAQAGPYSSGQTGSSSYSSGQSGAPYSSGQAGSSFNSGQSASSYQSNQSASSYPSGQSVSSYQPSVTQAGSSTYQRESQGMSNQNQTGYPSSYGSSSHQAGLQTSPMSASKLTDSLSKMSVKDNALEQTSQVGKHDYTGGSTSTATLTTTTATTSTSMAGGSVSVSTALGLATTSVSSATTNVTKPVATSKAPPNLPPGVPPLLGHNYIMQQMGQPGMPFYANLAAAAAQQPVYSYEDLQLLQQRIALHGYYDMPFQPPTTLAGRDQTTLGSVPYTGTGADGKLSRVDAQSPVQQAQTTQQQQQQQTQQQAFINPATLPPGYGYYYPGGMLPTGGAASFYMPTTFPVPPATNAAHAGTTATSQFQKPGAYGSYGTGYDDLNQSQDFKTPYGATQTQSKAGSVASVTSTTDMVYSKTHTQSFDKQAGFHAGTPPPFNTLLPTGSQTGHMGAPTAYGAPFMPMMAHQPHSQMLHHHLQQDSTGSSRGSAQSSTQVKPGGTKNYSTAYWGAN